MSPAGLDAIAKSLQAQALNWGTIKVENPALSVARRQEELLEAGMDLQAKTLETLVAQEAAAKVRENARLIADSERDKQESHRYRWQLVLGCATLVAAIASVIITLI